MSPLFGPNDKPVADQKQNLVRAVVASSALHGDLNLTIS